MKPLLLITDIRRLASRADTLTALLSEERQKTMNGYRFSDDRLRSLAAGLLMREVAGERRILYGEFGRPYLADGPHFNISHSGEYVVMAVAGEPVGVDIEKHCEHDYAALASVSFHPNERCLLAANYTGQFFYDMWTLKESYMKMTGKGFSLEPSGFCLSLNNLSARLVLPENVEAAFKLYDGIQGYSLAVCLSGGEFPKTITWFQP